jgi:hypothetical protein
VETHKGRSISRDSWDLLLEFATTVNSKLSNYDPEGKKKKEKKKKKKTFFFFIL